jgi:para-aminobenzoate synthetase component 1
MSFEPEKNKRKTLSFTVKPSFNQQLLYWANQFRHVCIFNSNSAKSGYELVAGVDNIGEISPLSNSFESLKKIIDEKKDWLFGSFSYDLKNEIESLSSKNPDGIGFPMVHFFQPKYIFIIRDAELEVQYINEVTNQVEIETIISQIKSLQPTTYNIQPLSIKARISRNQYLNAIQGLQQHIQQGDVYEVNFCQEFYAENADIDPVATYEKLNAISEAPFSCFYKIDWHYAMCASPERFLKRTGNKIISQPIKGTRRRGNDIREDEKLKKELLSDEKERSENVMIVDLVRNDLSRTAKRGSVKVDELFGVYTFKQVHQLISTVSSEIKEGTHPVDVIKNAFPMGSMTGAPKIRAMELIEQYESRKRGLFSGSIGYFEPNGNFDFNVVIRSILYNNNTHYLSFCTGGAITAKADPEAEYEECMVKAKAMFEVLESSC